MRPTPLPVTHTPRVDRGGDPPPAAKARRRSAATAPSLLLRRARPVRDRSGRAGVRRSCGEVDVPAYEPLMPLAGGPGRSITRSYGLENTSPVLHHGSPDHSSLDRDWRKLVRRLDPSRASGASRSRSRCSRRWAARQRQPSRPQNNARGVTSARMSGSGDATSGFSGPGRENAPSWPAGRFRVTEDLPCF